MWTTFYAFPAQWMTTEKCKQQVILFDILTIFPSACWASRDLIVMQLQPWRPFPGFEVVTGSSPSLFGFLGVLSFFFIPSPLVNHFERAQVSAIGSSHKFTSYYSRGHRAIHRLTTHIIMSRGKSAKCGLRHPPLLFEGGKERYGNEIEPILLNRTVTKHRFSGC